ncbi:DUF1003 domain-containing protein [Pseudonocardia xinjiangensis]|uniref:DUF1003 domain-containing protein n=1 Tax=Pseudonocardia xinjiangensis TaxID=75289 RepID=A0ABX1REZ0_9PSEU|nr:DUF1003 domain-containing protein [Pseudonocardia xinjiangensis]
MGMTSSDVTGAARNPTRWRHPANQRLDRRRRGERIADQVTTVFGSWRFIVIQTAIVAAWIALNLVAVAQRWDPYPFILLNAHGRDCTCVGRLGPDAEDLLAGVSRGL